MKLWNRQVFQVLIDILATNVSIQIGVLAMGPLSLTTMVSKAFIKNLPIFENNKSKIAQRSDYGKSVIPKACVL